jgi:hypothetical protein
MSRLCALAGAVLILAVTASPAAADSSVVGHWPLDDAVGTTVRDSSGFGNTGTLSGRAAWVPGLTGSALSFDGQSGQVKVPNSPSLEPPTAVTVSAWVRHAGSPGAYRYILAKGATGCTAAAYGLYTGPGGGLEFYVSKDRGTAYARSVDAGTRVWDGSWHLVVGTFDGDVIRLYVDGTEIGTGVSYPGPLVYRLPDSNDLYIGNYPGCQEHEFHGVIDDVTVWSGALTPSQVRHLLPTPGGSGSPPAASSSPGSGGGGASSAAPGSDPSGASGPGSPALTSLRLSGTILLVGADGKVSHAGHRTGLTISYSDRQGALVILTLVRIESGVRIGRRCVAPTHQSRRNRVRCTRQVTLGSFTHNDGSGRTTIRFTGLPGRPLTPGRYRLIMTPRSHGRVGPAVVVQFSVRRRG